MIQDVKFLTVSDSTEGYELYSGPIINEVGSFSVLHEGVGENLANRAWSVRLNRYGSENSATEPMVNGHDLSYAALYSALQEMSELDDEEAMFIDADTFRSACSALNFIRYYELPTPKVFSHGGDAVVFTWDFGQASLQLTVSNGIAALGRRVKGEGVFSLGYVDLSSRNISELFPFLQVRSGRAGSNSLR
ncbi:hypothetical protein [Rhizobium wenxiniae]|uniref:hypothetical protein n=1 Tax=Rhizobium wenxiniae TaxID=1737357 RepID=UPI003C1A9EF5